MAETKFLVIADKKSFITQIQSNLANVGYTTLGLAVSTTQAIQMATQILPDLVLVDITENKADRLKAAQQLQELYDIPVIFLTDNLDNNIPKQIKLAQPFDYILKSFDERVIGLTIELVLYKKKLQVSNHRLSTILTKNQQAEVIKQEQDRFVEALCDIATALNSALNLNELLDHILINIERVISYDTANIMFLEAGSVYVASNRSYIQQGQTPVLGMRFSLPEIPNLHEMAKTGQPLIIPDTYLYPDWIDIPTTHWIRSYAGVPIRLHEQIVGFLNLASSQPGFYSQIYIQRLRAFADQAGIAIGNTRLLEVEREQRELAQGLREVGSTLNASLDFDTILDRLLDQVAHVAPYDTGNVFLIEGGVARVVRTRGHDKLDKEIARLAANLSFDLAATANMRHIVESKEPLIIPNTSNDPNWLQGATWGHVRSWAGAPIVAKGQVIAFFSLDKIEPDFYQPKHAERLAIFAGQVGLALENARLYQAERDRYHEAEAMRQAALALTSTIAMDQVLEHILVELQRVVPYDSASVQLIKADSLEIIGGHGFPNLNELLGISLPIQSPDNPNAIVLKSREPIIIQDVRLNYAAFSQEPHAVAKIRAWMGVPLFIGERTIGMLALDKRIPNFYTDAHARTAMSYAAQAAVAIENAQLYKQAQRHAAELELRVAERTFELEVLYELTQALGQATQLGDVVRLILIHLYRAIPHDVAASLLVGQPTCTLVIQSQRPFSAQVEANIQEIMCAVLNQPVTNTIDIRRIQSKADLPSLPPLEDLASIMQVPIIINDTSVGLLFVATEQPNQFNQEQVHLLRTVADQAAESIHRLQRLLAAEYQRLESLVAHLPDGIVLLNAERRIVLANHAAQSFLATLTTSTVGSQLNCLGGQDIDTIINPYSMGLPQEIETPDYPRRIFEIIAMPMAAGPEAGGWVLVIRDVTIERATQERTQQQDRLVAVGQLAAGIAHDFNNILTSMIGFAELARIHPNIPPAIGEDLQRIIQQGQRAATLIRQILDFSRQSITEKRSIDFASFLRETIKLLERTIPEDIQITLEIEPGSREVYTFNADPTQIQQVLTNLALNARDALPTGGMLHFQLAHLLLKPSDRSPYPDMSPGYWMALSISDNGSGISPEVLPRIFEPFFTTKEVGKGTGLGLAQVYGIITQHEGYIDVQTELGKGTTFTIYLPATLIPQPPLQTTEFETTRGHGEMILLVEDDLAVLEVTQAMLEHLGYRVITATNGRQALELYDQYQSEIALVLTDITMPEMGGVVLSQNLQAKYPAIKVVALTGYPLATESKYLLNQGIIDWLQKPVNRRQLAQTISRSLTIQIQNVVGSEKG